MKSIFILLIVVLFTTSIISTSVFGIIDSPRKQMMDGVSAEDVICKNELQLMLKYNDAAICVKSSSVERLVSFGIAEVVDISTRELEMNDELDIVSIPADVKDVDLSPEKILVLPQQTIYQPGSTMFFTGKALPNQDLEVSLEDPNGNELFVDILEIDDDSQVSFHILTEESYEYGTYFLVLKQSDDSEIVPVLIGEQTGDIAVVIEKFHFDLNSQATLEIFGPSSSNLLLTILDIRDDIRFEDTILLEPTGFAEYSLDLSGYKKGVYSVVVTHASEETIEEFTVGLRNGIVPIEITLTDNYYKIGETALVLGKSSDDAQILIELIDPSGKIIDKIEHYTDGDGKFSYLLTIPLGEQIGIWKVQVSTGDRISELPLEVIKEIKSLTVQLDMEEPYKSGDFVTIFGAGINSESQVVIQIKSPDKIFELTPKITKEGEYSTVWQVPEYSAAGTYTVSVDDGVSQATTKLIVVY